MKTLIAICTFSMVAGFASGNMLTNPSFETPVVSPGGFTNYPTGSTLITGWTVTGPAGTEASIVSTTFTQGSVNFEAKDGNQWLDLTGDGSNSTEGVSQSVATTSGTNYVLTFYIGNTTGGGIFGTTSTDALFINGTNVGNYENSNTDATGLNWEQFTYDFMASGSSTTIGFANRDPGGDNSNGLDLVNLEVGTSTVPEPATVGLVGLALVAIAFRRRQSASRSQRLG